MNTFISAERDELSQNDCLGAGARVQRLPISDAMCNNSLYFGCVPSLSKIFTSA